MSVAKRLLAKLARFYRRLTRSPMAKKMVNMKYNTKCHKRCGTMPEEIVLHDIDNSNKRLDIFTGRTSVNTGCIVRTRAELVPEPRSTHSMIRRRIQGGHEAGNDVAVQVDGGPMLENGISRVAFCRQLDSLLKRCLGVESDASYC